MLQTEQIERKKLSLSTYEYDFRLARDEPAARQRLVHPLALAFGAMHRIAVTYR